jgi:hypothetical protein
MPKSNRDDDDKPNFWVSLIKKVLGIAVFLVLLGLGLYYSAEYKTYSPSSSDQESQTDNSWGITKDSPIYRRR